VIEYPAAWKGWTKNLAYPPVAHLPSIRQGFANNWQRVSSLTLFEGLMLMLQIEAGIQYVVEKRVTDDLMLSDIEDIHFSELPWPSRSMEFYFEDPAIPTMILQRRDTVHLKEELAKFPENIRALPVKGDGSSMVRMLVQELNAPVAVQLNLESGEMDAFALDGHSIKPLESTLAPDPYEARLDADEHLGLKELALLAYKVMIYAAVPGLKPNQVGRNALHMGGRPGVKNRPQRQIFRVVDVPLQYREDPSRKPKSEGGKEFNGRRGHFHHYRSERFVNRKGTFDYFPPVYGADGTLPKVRCRVKYHEKSDTHTSDPAVV
jgi:hypothetical protein